MMRRRFITASAAAVIPAAMVPAAVEAGTNTSPKTGYAPVNGLYYEIHGSGEPLVLLHGG